MLDVDEMIQVRLVLSIASKNIFPELYLKLFKTINELFKSFWISFKGKSLIQVITSKGEPITFTVPLLPP